MNTNAEQATTRAARIKELIAKYPEPWVIEKEPHNYNDGTNNSGQPLLHSMFEPAVSACG